MIEGPLGDVNKVGTPWHEAADALVGVFHGTFLPRRTGVAEPAPRADALFQSPESGKLRAAIKGEALAREGVDPGSSERLRGDATLSATW